MHQTHKIAYLYVSADLLLTREALVTIPSASVPITIVMVLPAADMRRVDMIHQRFT